jgi:hypothetical protein
MDGPATDWHTTIFAMPSLALAIEKQPHQARPERTAQEYPPTYDFERKHHRGHSLRHQRSNGNEASLVPRRGANPRFQCSNCGSQLRFANAKKCQIVSPPAVAEQPLFSIAGDPHDDAT